MFFRAEQKTMNISDILIGQSEITASLRTFLGDIPTVPHIGDNLYMRHEQICEYHSLRNRSGAPLPRKWAND
jgi:hypothetical protein